jgi:hypothetical protein
MLALNDLLFVSVLALQIALIPGALLWIAIEGNPGPLILAILANYILRHIRGLFAPERRAVVVAGRPSEAPEDDSAADLRHRAALSPGARIGRKIRGAKH